MFGTVKAPLRRGGRPRSLTPVMIQSLCDYLLEKPHLYLDEMVAYIELYPIWDAIIMDE